MAVDRFELGQQPSDARIRPVPSDDAPAPLVVDGRSKSWNARLDIPPGLMEADGSLVTKDES